MPPGPSSVAPSRPGSGPRPTPWWLPTVETVAPPSPVARSTVTALQSGIVYGFAGLVDGLVSRISLELGAGVTTVATGGSATPVLDACVTIDHHDPALTLKGLRLVWQRNAS
jgi:type III pantothenate kinase